METTDELQNDCTSEQFRESVMVDSLEECCDNMNSAGFDAIGCENKKIEFYFSDENLKKETDLIFSKLSKQNKYIPFQLKDTRLSDPAGWCQHQGWNQGIHQSDCFLDTVFFSFFGNDKLSTKFSAVLDKFYTDSETSPILKNIAYCISLYAELLKRGTKPNMKLNINDIIFKRKNRFDTSLRFKQALKWCLLWYMCEYILNTFGNDTPEYEMILIMNQSIIDHIYDFDGGNIIILLKIFKIIFDNFTIKFRDDNSLHILDNCDVTSDMLDSEPPKKINMVIKDILSTHTRDNDILIVPFLGKIIPGRPYNELFSPLKGQLESIIIQIGLGHVICYTHCNDKWLKYNNQNYPTTYAYEDNLPNRSNIIDLLSISKGINILIYLTKKPIGGFKKSLKLKKSRKNKKSKKNTVK